MIRTPFSESSPLRSIFVPGGLLLGALAALATGLGGPQVVELSASAGGTDADGDGIPDTQEEVLGTSEFLADSDGDGFYDSEELAGGTDPLIYQSQPGESDVAIGLTARGEGGMLRLHFAVHADAGVLDGKQFLLGIVLNGRTRTVPLARFLPYADVEEVVTADNGVVRTVDLGLSPHPVHALGALTYFVAVGDAGLIDLNAAAKVDIESVDGVLILRQPVDSVQTSQGQSSTGGGSIRVPIPTGGTGGIPPTWQPGQVCFQRSSVTGTNGPSIINEITSAGCIPGWDTYCPSDCSATVGSTFETLDPAVLLGD